MQLSSLFSSRITEYCEVNENKNKCIDSDNNIKHLQLIILRHRIILNCIIMHFLFHVRSSVRTIVHCLYLFSTSFLSCGNAIHFVQFIYDFPSVIEKMKL